MATAPATRCRFNINDAADVQRLIAHAKERCPDYMDPKYKQIEDMFGDDLSKQELKVIVDKLMIIDMAKTIAPRDMHGAWALHRDVYNDRGDESSQLARQRSIEELGIILGLREPPWVRPHPVKKEWWTFLHGATLYCEGLKRAVEADVAKQNQLVQMAVAAPIEGVTVYHKDMNEAMSNFLVDYANLVNGENTQVTVLQTWRSTAPTNKGWHRKKEDNGWSKETLGSQEELNQKHLCYARSLHPKRWGHVKWRAYEAAASFFSLAPQVKLVVTLEGVSPIPDDQPKTVWADVASWIQDKAAGPSPYSVVFAQQELSNKEKKEKAKPKISPEVHRNVHKAEASALKLAFWGRVIDKATAVNLPREYILPLEPMEVDGTVVGPDLYLDGSWNLNNERSNFCAAWFVKRVPGKAKARDADASQSATKKAKTTAVIHASHDITYDRVTVQVGDTKYSYGVPSLTSIIGNDAPGKCHRRDVPYDTQTLEKPKREKREKGTKFVLL